MFLIGHHNLHPVSPYSTEWGFHLEHSIPRLHLLIDSSLLFTGMTTRTLALVSLVIYQLFMQLGFLFERQVPLLLLRCHLAELFLEGL